MCSSIFWQCQDVIWMRMNCQMVLTTYFFTANYANKRLHTQQNTSEHSSLFIHELPVQHTLRIILIMLAKAHSIFRSGEIISIFNWKNSSASFWKYGLAIFQSVRGFKVLFLIFVYQFCTFQMNEQFILGFETTIAVFLSSFRSEPNS